MKFDGPAGTLDHERANTPMVEAQPNPIPLEIEPEDVHARLESGDDLLLLDCRTTAEHETACIEQATLIPLQEMSIRIDELEPWRERPVVVFCHKGARSLIITRLLRHLGFIDVRSMHGGIDRWSADIDTSIPKY